MPKPEQQEILERLERGRAALRQALSGVDERLAAARPGPGAWSILECVEHLAASERFLLSRLSAATPADQSQANPARETRILECAIDRANRVTAPEPGRPHGRFHSLADAVAAFDSVRAETIRFVEAFSADLRSASTSHPLIPGPINCYEMLLMLALHPARHARQIEEVRRELGSLR